MNLKFVKIVFTFLICLSSLPSFAQPSPQEYSVPFEVYFPSNSREEETMFRELQGSEVYLSSEPGRGRRLVRSCIRGVRHGLLGLGAILCELVIEEVTAPTQPVNTHCDQCHLDAWNEATESETYGFEYAYCQHMNTPGCLLCPDRPGRPSCRTTSNATPGTVHAPIPFRSLTPRDIELFELFDFLETLRTQFGDETLEQSLADVQSNGELIDVLVKFSKAKRGDIPAAAHWVDIRWVKHFQILEAIVMMGDPFNSHSYCNAAECNADREGHMRTAQSICRSLWNPTDEEENDSHSNYWSCVYKWHRVLDRIQWLACDYWFDYPGVGCPYHL